MGFRRYMSTTAVLIKKNVFLSVRDGTPLFVTLSSAFFSMLILYFSQISINNGDGFAPEKFDTPDPTPDVLSTIPRCVPVTFENCWTIAYVPKGNERVQAWVMEVAERSGIPENETIAIDGEDELNDHFLKNPNRTQAAYIFDSESLEQYAEGNVRFIVQYNDTEQADFPIGETLFHTQVVLPTMIHTMNLVLMAEVTGMTVDIALNTSVFPHPPIITFDGDTDGLDAFGLYGPLLTFGTYFLALVFFLYKMVLERERGLRDAMKLAGQFQSQHYLSWCVPYTVFMLVLTLLLIAFGHAFRFKFFTNNDFAVYFLTMFIFSLSLIGWTMLMATLTRRSESVSIVAFNLFFFGYLISSIGLQVYALDENGESLISDNVLVLREIFALAPSTMYVKALQDGSITALTGTRLTLETAGTYTSVFPIKDCWIWMVGSGIVTFLLAIYLDNVLPSKHGAPLSPFYLFMPSYWGFGRRKNVMLFGDDKDNGEATTDSDESPYPQGQTEVQSYDPDAEDADVRTEREAVARGDRESAALLIKSISKSFGKLAAVDDVSFSVKKNTAFALLGHNGAGKSTLFNMLVTSLSPTQGDAFIFGLSVRHDQAQVRKLLGVCPQFDIYWDKLTGAEHIEIFAALKGLNRRERRPEISERLEDVYLTKQADVLAGAYSGGMQRRLSVAISLTGDPKIVLLDECTSGADPLVRRDLWATIDRAKKGRVIFLITHSIAEAQHIAGHNAIGIMAKGKLRVLGNAMHLKSKFGAGYRLLAVLRRAEDASRLAAALNAVCPGTALTSITPGENTEQLADYSLPRLARESEILQAVNILEVQREEFQVMDYSLNSANLGDVFKSITSLSEDVQEDEGGDKKRGSCCLP